MSGEPEPSTAGARQSLALYVHWPFCLSKCPYCDFNSHVRESVDQARWRGALLRELDHFSALLPGATVTSIFFGGGTPSLMPSETAAAVIDGAAARWTLATDAEITLEANPTSTEAARLEDFRAAGINRVSLGVQALDDDALKFLGRGHDAAEARQAVALAQRIMPRSSFDLIYARPGQAVEAWREELSEALSFAGDHLSLYQLTVEKGTLFWRQERDGAFALPGDDTGRAPLRPDPGDHGGGRLFRPTRSPTMRAAAMPAATISPTGATTTTWVSDPAPTAAYGSRRAAGRRRDSTPAPKPGSPPSSAWATARPRHAPSTPTNRRARC